MYLYECTKPNNIKPSEWDNCKICKVANCGYSRCFEYNEKYLEQNGICGYEHCIENMPLYEEESNECIRLGYFVKLVKGKGWVRCNQDDEGATPDLNRYISEFGPSNKSCPIFGHDCPGDKEQVEVCKKFL